MGMIPEPKNSKKVSKKTELDWYQKDFLWFVNANEIFYQNVKSNNFIFKRHSSSIEALRVNFKYTVLKANISFGPICGSF